VWTTCLVFFQSVLLAGYAYADSPIARRAAPGAAARRLLALSLVFLPILASSDWKPQGDEQPIVRILLLLLPPSACPTSCCRDTPLLQACTGAASGAACPIAVPRSPTWLRCSRWSGSRSPSAGARPETARLDVVVRVRRSSPLRAHRALVDERLRPDEAPAATGAAPLSLADAAEWLALAALGS